MKCASETMGHRGHGADVERLGVGAVHGVAGAQQAPVQVLGFAAHGANATPYRDGVPGRR